MRKNKHITEIFENENIAVKLALIRDVRAIVEILIKSVIQDELDEKVGSRYKHNKQGHGVFVGEEILVRFA